MQTFNNGQKNKEIQSIKVELHVSTNKNQFDGKFCKTWVCILGNGWNGDGPFKLIVYDADETWTFIPSSLICWIQKRMLSPLA